MDHVIETSVKGYPGLYFVFFECPACENIAVRVFNRGEWIWTDFFESLPVLARLKEKYVIQTERAVE